MLLNKRRFSWLVVVSWLLAYYNTRVGMYFMRKKCTFKGSTLCVTSIIPFDNKSESKSNKKKKEVKVFTWFIFHCALEEPKSNSQVTAQHSQITHTQTPTCVCIATVYFVIRFISFSLISISNIVQAKLNWTREKKCNLIFNNKWMKRKCEHFYFVRIKWNQ